MTAVNQDPPHETPQPSPQATVREVQTVLAHMVANLHRAIEETRSDALTTIDQAALKHQALASGMLDAFARLRSDVTDGTRSLITELEEQAEAWKAMLGGTGAAPSSPSCGTDAAAIRSPTDPVARPAPDDRLLADVAADIRAFETHHRVALGRLRARAFRGVQQIERRLALASMDQNPGSGRRGFPARIVKRPAMPILPQRGLFFMIAVAIALAIALLTQ